MNPFDFSMSAVALDAPVLDAGQTGGQNRYFVVPDLLCRVGCPVVAETFGDLFENPPVGFGFARRPAYSPDTVDAAFAVGESALVLTPGGSRQHDIGKARGLVGKDVLDHQEFSRSEFVFHLANVRLGIGQIFTENIERPHFARRERFQHLRDHKPRRFREARHFPGFGEFCPDFRVRHGLVTGKHIWQSPHVAGALHIVLATQRVDAAALHTEVSEQHLKIGDGLYVVFATGVFGDTQGVAEHHGLDRSDPSGERPNHFGGDAANRGRMLGRIRAHAFFQLFKADGAGTHEFVVIKVLCDQHMHQ